MPEKPRTRGLGPNQRETIRTAMQEMAKVNTHEPVKDIVADHPTTLDSKLSSIINDFADKTEKSLDKTNVKLDELNHTTQDTIDKIAQGLGNDESKEEVEAEEEPLITDIDKLVGDPGLAIPPVYGDTPEGIKREQILDNYLLKYNKRYIDKIVAEGNDMLTEAQIAAIESAATRYSKMATYVRAHHNDRYLDFTDNMIDAFTEQLITITDGHIDEKVLRMHAGSIVWQGGSAIIFSNGSTIRAKTLDITNPVDRALATEQGANLMLDNIEKMRQGALQWYFARLTGNPKAKVPEGVTIEQLLKEGGWVPNIRRASMYAIVPAVATISGGLAAAPILGHLAAATAGGAAGLAGTAWWNKRGKGGNSLYEARLLKALSTFNKQLDREQGYTSKPKIGWLRNNLNQLNGQPASLGKAFSELSRNDLHFILDKFANDALTIQKRTRLTVAAAAAAFAVVPHLNNAAPTMATPAAPTTPAASPAPPVVTTYKSWLQGVSDFFKFNGVNGAKFEFPPTCYSRF